MIQASKEIFTFVALGQTLKQTKIAPHYLGRSYSNPDFAPLEAAGSTHV